MSLKGKSFLQRTFQPWTIGCLVVALLCSAPAIVSPFVMTEIIGQALWFGIIVSSFAFLSAYCGMMSLLQTTIAGISGYTFGCLATAMGWGILPAVCIAVLIGTISGIVFGTVARRSYGSYFFMITLALAILVYYFTFQVQGLTGGHAGLNGIPRPGRLGSTPLDLGSSFGFYYFSLLVAVISYIALTYIGRSPLGTALRGVRDNAERMESLGFNVSVLRVAGFAIAAIFASIGGLFSVWYNGAVSPESINFAEIIDVVVAAVIGGMYNLEGAWVGALVVTVLANYASEVTGRFNTLIGIVLIAAVILFPDGVAGVVARWRQRGRPEEHG
jgi:branched-chain amino acid transport system permease protein